MRVRVSEGSGGVKLLPPEPTCDTHAPSVTLLTHRPLAVTHPLLSASAQGGEAVMETQLLIGGANFVYLQYR